MADGEFNEEMILQILHRCPAATVARFRAVSSRWRDIIYELAFRRNYGRNRYPLPMFFCRRDFDVAPFELDVDPGAHIARVELHALDLAATKSEFVIGFPDFPAPARDDDDGENFPADDAGESVVTIQGSCDGILLLSCLGDLRAVSPYTRRFANLPPVHLHGNDDRGGIVGFYRFTPPGAGTVYRLLYRIRMDGIQDDTGYGILELGRVHEARLLGRPISPLSPPELLRILAEEMVDHFEPPVLVGGRLHWRPLPVIQPYFVIVAFDVNIEQFSCFSPPAQVRMGQLLELNDTLAMAVIPLEDVRPHMDIWVRIDGAWSRRYNITLAYHDLSQIHVDIYGDLPVLAVWQNNRLYVLLRGRYILAQHIINATGSSRYHHSTPDENYRIITTSYMLQETFAQHEFLSIPF